MNTIFSPKRALFVAIFLALATFTGVPRVEAQVTSAEVEAIVKQITDLQVQLLLAQIAELKAQIATLVAEQASTTATVAQLNRPILGSTAKVTTAKLNNIDCIVHAPYTELDKIKVPLIVDGEWNTIRIVFDRKQVMAGYNSQGYAVIPSNGRQKEEILISKGDFRIGEPWFEVHRYPDIYDMKIGVDNRPLTNHVLEVKQCEV